MLARLSPGLRYGEGGWLGLVTFPLRRGPRFLVSCGSSVAGLLPAAAAPADAVVVFGETPAFPSLLCALSGLRIGAGASGMTCGLETK